MERKSIDPYIDSRVKIQGIPEISGYGVFADAFIPAGTVLEKAQLIVYSQQLMEVAIYLLQAEGVRSQDFVLDQYAIQWKPGQTAIPLGWAAIYNHSDNNNCRFATYEGEELLSIITTRDIQPGEQCCVNYGPDWFAKKGWIKKVDF